MTAAKKEIIFGLSFVLAYALLSHFSRSTAIVSGFILGIFEAFPIVLTIAGWWRWPGAWRDENSARWRKIVGLLGLVVNALVACSVWASFLYGVFVVDMHHSNGFRGIDLYPVIVACLILSVGTLGVGMAAPRRIRLAVVLGGFTMSWLILLIIGHAGVL